MLQRKESGVEGRTNAKTRIIANERFSRLNKIWGRSPFDTGWGFCLLAGWCSCVSELLFVVW